MIWEKKGGHFLSSRTIPAAKQEKITHVTQTSRQNNRIFRCICSETSATHQQMHSTGMPEQLLANRSAISH